MRSYLWPQAGAIIFFVTPRARDEGIRVCAAEGAPTGAVVFLSYASLVLRQAVQHGPAFLPFSSHGAKLPTKSRSYLSLCHFLLKT